MPKIDVYDYDEYDDATFEPIRRNNDPVSHRQTTQRRAEDSKNRHIKQARRIKESLR